MFLTDIFYRILVFFSTIFSIILLFLSTIIPGFEKSTSEFHPGENPTRFQAKNPFKSLFRSANSSSGPNRSDFQRGERENFYTQRRGNTGKSSGGPGLGSLLGGG